MLAVSVRIGFALTRLALRPVRLIRETASRISSDNLSERIPVASIRDEISELALLLNLMFDRLEISFRQIRRFKAEASHELKTPISLIRLQAEKLLVHGNLDADNEESVHVQLEEVSRLSNIIEELLFLSRAESFEIRLNLTTQDPKAILMSFSQDARVLAEHRGLQFACSHQGLGNVLAQPHWLRRGVGSVAAIARRRRGLAAAASRRRRGMTAAALSGSAESRLSSGWIQVAGLSSLLEISQIQ